MCGGRINPYCCPGWQQGPSVGLCIVRKYLLPLSLNTEIFHRQIRLTSLYFQIKMIPFQFKFCSSPSGYICSVKIGVCFRSCESRTLTFSSLNNSPSDISSLCTRPAFPSRAGFLVFFSCFGKSLSHTL